MTKESFIESKLKEFDEQFGVDEDSAGCDGCYISNRIRDDSRELLKSSLSEAWDKGMLVEWEDKNIVKNN